MNILGLGNINDIMTCQKCKMIFFFNVKSLISQYTCQNCWNECWFWQYQPHFSPVLGTLWHVCGENISMAQCKTAVTPLLTHWSYCRLALNHQYNFCWSDFRHFLQCNQVHLVKPGQCYAYKDTLGLGVNRACMTRHMQAFSWPPGTCSNTKTSFPVRVSHYKHKNVMTILFL